MVGEERFMTEAIRLATEGMRRGDGGPFGAVVVMNGEVIGRGCNEVIKLNDPTAHAEIQAIRDACRTVGDFDLAGAELYVNCEPCPMCLSAAYWAHLERIYYAADATDAARIGFDDLFIAEELKRPLSERRLPMVQLSREEALQAFAEWEAKPDRVPY